MFQFYLQYDKDTTTATTATTTTTDDDDDDDTDKREDLENGSVTKWLVKPSKLSLYIFQ